jgi:hypothetical protein
MFNTTVRAKAVGASRYGSGADQMMRLRLRIIDFYVAPDLVKIKRRLLRSGFTLLVYSLYS